MPAIRVWTPERSGLVAYLAGKGMTAPQIAADLRVQATEAAVRKHLSDLRISTRGACGNSILVRALTPAVTEGLHRAARRLDLSGPEELLFLICQAIGEEPNPETLVRNIVDDLLQAR
ncbi:hypothetical protein [Chelatococcus reniformis]|uniref:Uncharacterized protein n=1 Tax=Chelatococcus reniformis TaxID=1494448 RepID=A0A916XNQ6_9HYPH|nr:hypothetical protein [Chelatococcus reniformis]GGC90555.1 hypothetical protein GCM10010994_55460 [Chelatococcus reniformis]